MRTFATVVTTVSMLGALSPISSANASTAIEMNPIDTHEYLVEFHKNPKKVMNTPLARRDQDGKLILPTSQPIGTRSPELDVMIETRDRTRAKICAAAGSFCDRKEKPGFWAEADKENQITDFLWEKEYVGNLLEMEQKGLTKAILPEAPWSDSFWPMNRGLIARRWMDKGFPDSATWLDNYNYYLARGPMSVGVNSMAASEKYDLLVGDYNFTLTQANWGAGQSAQKDFGYVPAWQGLCHGWAPASFVAANPKRAVTVRSPNGTAITFYPSDIKALASQSWGAAPPRVNFVGVRCKTSHPKEDEFGRVIDGACFDVNPATWHLAITNQIGVLKRAFVFDSTYDFQVWNYPVDAYSYKYFNPQTKAVSDRLSGAVVLRSEFSTDKFKNYRSINTKYVVGIAMEVTYITPTGPSTAPNDKVSAHTIKYVYDLELDDKGKIVGGEWYSNFHPDFIWQPPKEGKPLSVAEKQMSTPIAWDGKGPVPPELQAAARTSSRREQPVSVIVDTLVRMAQEPE